MKMEFCNQDIKQLQKDRNELRADLAGLQHTIIQLKEQLAVKSQQLSDATEQKQRRRFAHIKALNELRVTKASLEEIKEKRAALEQKLQKQLEEQNANFKQKLKERKDSFQKELSKLIKQHQQELLEREQKLNSQLCKEDENIKKLLLELSDQWVARAQHSAENKRALEWKIQQMLEDDRGEEHEEDHEQKQLEEETDETDERECNEGCEAKDYSNLHSKDSSASYHTATDHLSVDHKALV